MARSLLPAVINAVAIACCLPRASAQDAEEAQTRPFQYTEGFESAVDPVRFWTSYEKKYTVHSKGVTSERARSGRQSFKLDVTFDEASRFLWHIPLEKQVPAGGKLAFSGHMLLGEETTGTATLGLSFCFRPTSHCGCTAPYTFHESTEGEWEPIGGDFVQRGRQIAGSIMHRFMAQVRGEHVGVFLERIILDLRGEAGQRVVLYVDDLELSGQVPTEDAYREEMAERWAPAQEALEDQFAQWEAALDQAETALAALEDLSPEAEGLRREMAAKARDAREKVAAATEAGQIRKHEQVEIDSVLARLEHVSTIKALSDAERDGKSAVVYVARPISSTMILPDERLVPGTPSTVIPVVAAPGEYEPASFVVSALSPLDSLTVAVGDLRGEGGIIPGDRVDVRVVKCWYQAGTAWVGNGQDKSKRILVPELLLHDDALVTVAAEKQEDHLKLSFPEGEKYVWISDPTEVARGGSLPVETFPVKDSPVLLPVSLQAGKTMQFWLTVHVPGTATAGTYEGNIALKTAEATVAELTLKLDVLPFELLPPYYTSSMDYHGKPGPGNGTIGSWGKSWAQFRSELENMVAHGLRNCQHYNITEDILGEVLRIRQEVGMDNRTLYLKNTIPIGNPTDREALQTIKERVRDVLELTRAYGTETVYFYGMDERRGEELVSQRPAWTAVREAGGKIFVAGYEENIDLMGDIQDMHVRAGRPNREEVAKWHALGHKIFCYANPQTGVENPVVYRRNFGLVLWKYDYDGAATNAYQHTFGATWNDFDHRTYRAHTIAYPTVDGVVDTIAWEGYREGVDDVRYVTTLQSAIEAARKSDDPTRQRKADAAEEYLRELKSGTAIETGDLDQIRQEIVGHILGLEPPEPVGEP